MTTFQHVEDCICDDCRLDERCIKATKVASGNEDCAGEWCALCNPDF